MRRLLIFILYILISFHGVGQLTDEDHQNIDDLFVEWNRPNHPGGVVGIMQDGEIIFLRSYGLSSLEYLVPNTTETIFNTASVSKQFTAMGIVKLHQDGKISIDDDIRKHVPELPEFKEKITVRHLLHHTSGLRSLHALLGLAGWRGDDARTNEDLYRFMAKQQDLNFRPGDEYLYCNTGYIYMAKIIENVTGEEFTSWMKNEVFSPLGMRNTYVEDKYNRVVPQNATSYYGSAKNGFERAVEYWGYVGSGNMHSTVQNLLVWLNNFTNPTPGWEDHFEMLQTTDPFNDGEMNNYAFGVNIGKFNGSRSIRHGGSIGGYRSNVVSYPDNKLSIAVLTNFSSAGAGQKVNSISEILLGKGEKVSGKPDKIKSKNLSTEDLKEFEGYFWNDKGNYVRKMYVREDTLRYFRSETSESPLVPIGKNLFQMAKVDVDLKVKFERENGNRKMVVTINDGPPIISRGFLPSEPNSGEIASYTGEYYSPELETTYNIYTVGDTLFWHHSRHGDFKMKRIKKDVIEGSWPFGLVKYKRNEDDEVEGIFVSNGRVRNLWMEKKD